MLQRRLNRIGLLVVGMVAGGCGAYAVPGRGADLRSMQVSHTVRDQQTDPGVVASIDRKPLATFPATIAVARVQGSDYKERTIQLYGSGSYRVAVTMDVEKPEQFDRLAHQPMIRNLEHVNRLTLPEYLNSDQDLRTAAATLHADMLLIYTFDDTFEDRDNASLLTVVTLGIAPTKSLTIRSVASAVLLDTRNGYVYGAADATEKKTTLSTCWGENAAADAVREEVETKAFEKLCDNFVVMWGSVVKEYTAPAAPRG